VGARAEIGGRWAIAPDHRSPVLAGDFRRTSHLRWSIGIVGPLCRCDWLVVRGTHIGAFSARSDDLRCA